MRAEKPDDKSVMTYVSQFFHRFASQGEADTAGRRVANFVNFSLSKVGSPPPRQPTQATREEKRAWVLAGSG